MGKPVYAKQTSNWNDYLTNPEPHRFPPKEDYEVGEGGRSASFLYVPKRGDKNGAGVPRLISLSNPNLIESRSFIDSTTKVLVIEIKLISHIVLD